MSRTVVSGHWWRTWALAIAGVPLAASAALAAPVVVKYTPHMNALTLVGRADTDFVEFSNGRRMSVKALRQLDALAARTRSATRQPVPPALLVKPAATGTLLRGPADLAAALTRPDSDTVQFSAGLRATVAQIKFVQPYAEKQLGRPLSSFAPAQGQSGPAIQVGPMTSRAQWEDILKNHPDTEVIEMPTGQRVTVAELKQGLRARYAVKKNGLSPHQIPTTKGRAR